MEEEVAEVEVAEVKHSVIAIIGPAVGLLCVLGCQGCEFDGCQCVCHRAAERAEERA